MFGPDHDLVDSFDQRPVEHAGLRLLSQRVSSAMQACIVNFLLYQLGWLACVFGAASGRPWTGCSAAILLFAIHLGLVRDTRPHLLLSSAAAVQGLVVETMLIGAGVYRLSSSGILSVLPPVWIIVMWVQFATLLPFCLRWLSGRYFASSLMGFVGGPLAFAAGERLGAVTFSSPRLVNFVVVGAAWAAAMPILVAICDRLCEYSRQTCVYRWPNGTLPQR